jgi:DNA-binding Lrp family transcriptional regulator
VVTAFVLIRAEPRRIADLAAELAEIPGVAEVYSTAGDVDIVAVVRVAKQEDLAEVVAGRFARHEGIRETRSLIAFQAFSRHDLEAMWALGD